MNDLFYPADENINGVQPLKDNSFIIYYEMQVGQKDYEGRLLYYFYFDVLLNLVKIF